MIKSRIRRISAAFAHCIYYVWSCLTDYSHQCFNDWLITFYFFRDNLIFNLLLWLSINILLELTSVMHQCFSWTAIAHAQKLDDSLDIDALIDLKSSFSFITSYVHFFISLDWVKIFHLKSFFKLQLQSLNIEYIWF